MRCTPPIDRCAWIERRCRAANAPATPNRITYEHRQPGCTIALLAAVTRHAAACNAASSPATSRARASSGAT